jgi:hypothetical protein
MAMTISQPVSMSTATTSPDRGWIPTHDGNPHYMQLSRVGEQELPRGFPPQITSEMAWSGRNFEFDSSSFLALLPTHVRELEEATDQFRGTHGA